MLLRSRSTPRLALPLVAVRSKLLLLVAPFLKRWNYARHAEQITGGHKYLPPRQDVNAPGEGLGWTWGAGTRSKAAFCALLCSRGGACLQ